MTAEQQTIEGPQGPERVAVDLGRLHRVGARPGFAAYLRQIWDFRAFIAYDARSRVQSAVSKDRLGAVWLVLTPVLNGLTYYLIFGLLLQTSRGVENFVGFLIIGVFAFQYTAKSVTGGARSIAANRKVVEAFSFPRACLPIASIIRETMSFVPAFGAMLALVLLFPPLEPIGWTWFLALPVLGLQLLLNLGLGMLLARLAAGTRDILNIVSFGMRIWMYGSGVFYAFDRFIDHPTLLAVLELNPLHQVLTMLRQVLLYAEVPGWNQWIILGGWTAGALLIGIVVLWSAEEKYGKEA